MKILLIEDEPDLGRSIIEYLSPEGYSCEWEANYVDAYKKIIGFDYDCIILDLMLPGGDGFKLLEGLRRMERTEGVIIISARGTLEDRIKGLQLGADDYLPKPFHLAELSARVMSVVRRKQFHGINTLCFEELEIDVLSHTVKVKGLDLVLTKKEYDLLLFLVGNKDKIVSKNAVAEHLSGEMADFMDNFDFVYTHIKNLKKKLSEAGSADYIKTVYGVGYKWTAV